jgi:hypothetical protein
MVRLKPSPLPRHRTPPRLVREAAPFVLLACACGAAARSPAAGARPQGASAGLPSGDAAPGPDPFEALVARGPAIAPGMHQVARRDSAGEKIEIVHAEQQDTCIRVAFEASVPVVAKLVDGVGNVVAETGAAAVEGLLGEKGPVCIRKGEAVSVMVEGPGAAVRWVAWAAP